MANLGEVAELINSRRVRLDVGSDTYIALKDLHLHVGNIEKRIPITDTRTLYQFGKADNWFTATLLATTPEIQTFNSITQHDSNGDMLETDWKLVYRDRSGTSKTFTCKGILRDFDIEKGDKGGVKCDIFVRITTETVGVA